MWLRSGNRESEIGNGRSSLMMPCLWIATARRLRAPRFSIDCPHELPCRRGERGIGQRHRERRLHEAELVAAIEARAFEAVREHRLLGEQRLDRIGQLDFATRARTRLLEQ